MDADNKEIMELMNNQQKANDYLQFLANEVNPFIDSIYRPTKIRNILSSQDPVWAD
jgi:predicted alpha/beta superfamily hydrolase